MRSLILILLALSAPLSAQVELGWYFKDPVTFDTSVPRPSVVLGHEVGEWHARHDQIVAYMMLLAASSPRVDIVETGRTHEGRRLLLMAISSPENLARKQAIQENQRLLAVDPDAKVDTADWPLVAYMGYSIHGDESSGANAALLFAYWLAGAQGEAMDRLLAESVVLLDPCLNPDGLARFAQWANMHRGKSLVADRSSREHDQGWPSGRTNHYWFDLNRDWLLLTHPESRARIEQFHAWKPNLLTDFHEMGSNATYFFQPGVPTRTHPLTPRRNQDLTGDFAKANAAALDELGSLYFTEEMFDDFYFGKGSTYPDLNGAVGILFEQASSRGHLHETDNGNLSFPFTIRNQLTTSIATLTEGVRRRQEMHEWRRDFQRHARAHATADPVKAWVFAAPEDPWRTHRMIDILQRHRIEVRELARVVEKDGRRFEPGKAWVAKADQPQHLLLMALFEQRTEFRDDAFYDVSAWTMPAAFGVDWAGLSEADVEDDPAGDVAKPSRAPRGRGLVETDDVQPRSPTYAYAFDASPWMSGRALHALLADGIRVRVVSAPLTASLKGGGVQELARGSVVVTRGGQEHDEAFIRGRLDQLAHDCGLVLYELAGGLTPQGPDLGSSSLRPINLPRVALLCGPGTSAYDVGEAWYLMDAELGLPVALVEVDALFRSSLDRYTHLVVAGSVPEFSERRLGLLKDWLRAGGTLIATESAATWAESELAGLKPPKEPSAAAAADRRAESKPWSSRQAERAKESIGGAILHARVDRSHPLMWGVARDDLYVMRSGTRVLLPSSSPYGNVAVYADEPLFAGYCSEEHRKRFAGTAAIAVDRVGRGTVIRFADDPLFRGWFMASARVFTNALFHGE
ncbi:MAG: hypothetical protein KDB53_19650 [Planctomycetes bacterium]|nr:hypothetical protein [Planctomycetota bacterium]